jgi:hypothetical protein
MRVYIISFFGPHGSGKSTAADALYEYISERSYPSNYGLIKGSCLVRKAWESTKDVAELLSKHGVFFYGDRAYTRSFHLRNYDALVFTQCLINEQQTNQLHNAIASLADEVAIPDDVPRFVISSRSCDWVAYYTWWKVLASFLKYLDYGSDEYYEFMTHLLSSKGIGTLRERHSGVAPHKRDLLGLLTCSIYARPFLGLEDGIEFAETVHVMLRAQSNYHLYHRWLESGRGRELHDVYSNQTAYSFLDEIFSDITALFTENNKASWVPACLLAEPPVTAERDLPPSHRYSEKEIKEMAKQKVLNSLWLYAGEYANKKALTELWNDLDKLTKPIEY